LNGLAFPFAALAFLLAGYRPDVVLVQAGVSVFAYRIAFFASLLRAVSRRSKVVIKPWLVSWLRSDSVEPECGYLRAPEERVRWAGRALWGLMCNHTDRFVAITGAISDALASEGIPRSRTVKIPNGVDTNRFAPAGPNERERSRKSLGLSDRRVVTCMGSMKAVKGLDVLLRAWSKVTVSQPGAHLLFVGKQTPAGQFKSLSNLARQYGIGKSLTFVGEVREVRRYLWATDVFVLPSLREGMSNALLEALSCGLPVVTTDIPGMEEAVRNHVNGLVVPPGNHEALREGILNLLEDRELADRLGTAARKTAVERFSFDMIAPRYEELFERLCSRSGCGQERMTTLTECRGLGDGAR